jgi:hypothetical protein
MKIMVIISAQMPFFYACSVELFNKQLPHPQAISLLSVTISFIRRFSQLYTLAVKRLANTLDIVNVHVATKGSMSVISMSVRLNF